MKKILVIVDAQNDFIDGSLANEEAQRKVGNIVEKVKTLKDAVIIMTQDTHFENYLQTKEGKNLPIVHCVSESEGWNVNSQIWAAVNDREAETSGTEDAIKSYTFQKNTFGSIRLQQILQEFIDYEKKNGNDEQIDIELCGFCTDICVVSNALIIKAGFPDFNDVYVDASCCAGTTVANHKAAIDVMRSCQIIIENDDTVNE